MPILDDGKNKQTFTGYLLDATFNKTYGVLTYKGYYDYTDTGCFNRLFQLSGVGKRKK